MCKDGGEGSKGSWSAVHDDDDIIYIYSDDELKCKEDDLFRYRNCTKRDLKI